MMILFQCVGFIFRSGYSRFRMPPRQVFDSSNLEKSDVNFILILKIWSRSGGPEIIRVNVFRVFLARLRLQGQPNINSALQFWAVQVSRL